MGLRPVSIGRQMTTATIRPEGEGEASTIFGVNARAFETEVEAGLVDAVRRSRQPMISLVAGGLSRARGLIEAARSLDFQIMIGCMVATSMSMAPAMLLAGGARFVDLDGPLLLSADRAGGLDYHDSQVAWPSQSCWGDPRNKQQEI